jgi:hypothetical protein
MNIFSKFANQKIWVRLIVSISVMTIEHYFVLGRDDPVVRARQ